MVHRDIVQHWAQQGYFFEEPTPPRIWDGRIMETVKVNKEQLLAKLNENREKHRLDYEQTITDWKKAVLAVCEHNKEAIAFGTDNAKIIKGIQVIPVAPSSFVHHYDKAIMMLEFSVEGEIQLDSSEFSQLVMDEWAWKGQFDNLKASYSAFPRR